MADSQQIIYPIFDQEEDYTGAVTLLLNNGGGTIIDIERFEWACQWEWFCIESGRPNRPRVRRACRYGANKPIYLSRELMNPPRGLIVDHENRIPLDNRLHNLRNITQRANCFNGGPSSSRRHSPYHGVCWEEDRKKWKAYINFGGKNLNLGRFVSEVDAAKACNDFVRKHLDLTVCLNPV